MVPSLLSYFRSKCKSRYDEETAGGGEELRSSSRANFFERSTLEETYDKSEGCERSCSTLVGKTPEFLWSKLLH